MCVFVLGKETQSASVSWRPPNVMAPKSPPFDHPGMTEPIKCFVPFVWLVVNAALRRTGRKSGRLVCACFVTFRATHRPSSCTVFILILCRNVASVRASLPRLRPSAPRSLKCSPSLQMNCLLIVSCVQCSHKAAAAPFWLHPGRNACVQYFVKHAPRRKLFQKEF
jgi:hypothetical protein